MPKVSTKVQRRIAELDAEYTVAKSKRPVRHAVALIILAIIAVAAFSSAHRDTPGFSRLTLKQDASDTQAADVWLQGSDGMERRIWGRLHRPKKGRVM